MKKLSETYKELGIAFTFPIRIEDATGNFTYCEESDGDWYKCKYDANGKETYFEDSDGYWCNREYDANGKVTYYEDSNGHKVIETDGSGQEVITPESSALIDKKQSEAINRRATDLQY